MHTHPHTYCHTSYTHTFTKAFCQGSVRHPKVKAVAFHDTYFVINLVQRQALENPYPLEGKIKKHSIVAVQFSSHITR